MDLDGQLQNYFGTADIDTVPPAALNAGVERMLVDIGLSEDEGQRFGLWVLLHMLGAAPDLEATFPTEAERDAARNFMDFVAQADDE